MKEKIVPILVIVFVILTTIAYRSRVLSSTVGIDYLTTDFADIYNILPNNATIAFSGVYKDTVDFIEMFVGVRYALVPRTVIINATDRDTALMFFYKPPSQSEYNSLIGNRKILWEKKRNNAYLILTSIH